MPTLLRVLVHGVLIAALAVSPTALLALDQAAQRQARVTGAVANVRSQPAVSGQLLFQVRSGDVLQVVEASGDWYHVRDADGREGYVYKALVEIVEAARPAAATATAPGGPEGPVTIDHKEVGCVIANQYPKLDACLLPDSSVGRAQIHFRALVSDPWYAVDLKPQGPCFSAYLPKPLPNTTQIEYYVDVVDRSFREQERPESAPGEPYRVRVVGKEGSTG